MKIQFELEGKTRKELVKAISVTLEFPAVYRGAPTFAYAVGDYIIDGTGALDTPEGVDRSVLDGLISALAEQGFASHYEAIQNDVEGQGLVINGIDEHSYKNLLALISSKQTLIRTALGVSDLAVERTAGTVCFKWFDSESEANPVYARFAQMLCTFAKSQQHILARESATDNPKYTFRCFLLKLGYIGAEYKGDRKVLLSRLSGNTAFKSGKPKAE